MTITLLILPVVIALAVFGTIAHAQSGSPQYGIKFDHPDTGSRIKREAVHGSVVPINRTYAQLSRSDIEVVRSWYEGLKPEEEPPFPEDGLRPILDALRKAQAKLLVTGELFLIASIDPSGKVTEVEAIGAPSPEMVRFAATVLMLTRFKPAICSGSPCAMEFPIRQRFVVE